MSRRPTARASAWRFAFSLEGLRGKEVRRGAITCSIFTLDPPGASAHSHRTSSDFASEGYKVHLCMQQQNASATNFFSRHAMERYLAWYAHRVTIQSLLNLFCMIRSGKRWHRHTPPAQTLEHLTIAF